MFEFNSGALSCELSVTLFSVATRIPVPQNLEIGNPVLALALLCQGREFKFRNIQPAAVFGDEVNLRTGEDGWPVQKTGSSRLRPFLFKI